jgi:hypothetical protein
MQVLLHITHLQHYPILGIIGVCFSAIAWIVFKQVKKVNELIFII